MNRLLSIVLITLAFPAMADMSDRMGAGLFITNYQLKSNDYSEYQDDKATTASLFGTYKIWGRHHIKLQLSNLGSYESEDIDLSVKALTLSWMSEFSINDSVDFYGGLGYGLLSYDKYFVLGNDKIDISSTGDTIMLDLGVKFSPFTNKNINLYANYGHFYYVTSSSFLSESNSNNISGFGLGLRVKFN